MGVNFDSWLVIGCRRPRVDRSCGNDLMAADIAPAPNGLFTMARLSTDEPRWKNRLAAERRNGDEADLIDHEQRGSN
jgi:hypothetical protein